MCKAYSVSYGVSIDTITKIFKKEILSELTYEFESYTNNLEINSNAVIFGQIIEPATVLKNCEPKVYEDFLNEFIINRARDFRKELLNSDETVSIYDLDFTVE